MYPMLNVHDPNFVTFIHEHITEYDVEQLRLLLLLLKDEVRQGLLKWLILAFLIPVAVIGIIIWLKPGIVIYVGIGTFVLSMLMYVPWLFRTNVALTKLEQAINII